MEDQKTEHHQVSEIEIDPKPNRPETRDGIPEQQVVYLNERSDLQSSSAYNTQQNLVIGDYDFQSQKSEQSPFKREAPVVKIEGLRMNMDGPNSPKKSSPKKPSITDREALDSRNSAQRVNNSQLYLANDYPMNESYDSAQMRVLNTPDHRVAPSESTIQQQKSLYLQS